MGDGLPVLGAEALSGRAGVMLELLKARASPDQNNWRGLSARALAEREGFPDMFEEVMTILETHRGSAVASTHPALTMAAQNAANSTVGAAVECGITSEDIDDGMRDPV